MRDGRMRFAVAGLACWITGCAAGTGTPNPLRPPAVDPVALPALPGDPLVEQHPLLPFPSDVFLAPDATTVTGWRLAYPVELLPEQVDGQPFDIGPWERLDGMSPGGQILAAFEATPDLSGAAFHTSIERSLAADSPTLLLDLQTGEALAHWVEPDAQNDGQAMLVFLRPAQRLQPNRAYAVAFRDLRTEDATPIEPSAAFAAARDAIPTTNEAFEARRDGLEAMFDAIEAAGWSRSTLTLAWRFHTASDHAIRRDLEHMRDDALARLGPGGIGCTIEEVIDDHDGTLGARWVRGTMRVPSYVDDVGPPSRLVRDAQDLPMYVEDIDVPFSAIIPSSLVDAPENQRLVVFGHGLLGDHADYTQGVLHGEAEAHRSIIAATNWAGMSRDDIPVVATVLADVATFPNLSERLHQGMINQIALWRTLSGVCRTEPVFLEADIELIDPDRVYYAGASLGGILGITLMGLHPDIDRGLLYVGGAGFPFMIERSGDFALFIPLFESFYPSRTDRAIYLSMTQHLWDSVEGAGWLNALDDRHVLMVAAHNDAQVHNLATDFAMRSIGVPQLEGTSRPVYGFDTVAGPYDGSATITVDLGDRPGPEGNLPAPFNDGGHGDVATTPTGRYLLDTYLRPDGVADSPCDGVCDPD